MGGAGAVQFQTYRSSNSMLWRLSSKRTSTFDWLTENSPFPACQWKSARCGNSSLIHLAGFNGVGLPGPISRQPGASLFRARV